MPPGGKGRVNEKNAARGSSLFGSIRVIAPTYFSCAAWTTAARRRCYGAWSRAKLLRAVSPLFTSPLLEGEVDMDVWKPAPEEAEAEAEADEVADGEPAEA